MKSSIDMSHITIITIIVLITIIGHVYGQHLYYEADHYHKHFTTEHTKDTVREPNTGFRVKKKIGDCTLETGGRLVLRLLFGLKKTLASVAFYRCPNKKAIVQSEIYMYTILKSMFVNHINNLMKEKQKEFGFADHDLNLVERCMKGLGNLHYKDVITFDFTGKDIAFKFNGVQKNKFALSYDTFDKFYRLLLVRYIKTI